MKQLSTMAALLAVAVIVMFVGAKAFQLVMIGFFYSWGGFALSLVVLGLMVAFAKLTQKYGVKRDAGR